MRPHVPTSVALARLLNEAPQDHVTLAWLLGGLQNRSFGFLMLLLALLGLVPGTGVFIGVLLAFPAVQMILGRESPTLSRILASGCISTRHLAGLAARAIPLFERMEALIRPLSLLKNVKGLETGSRVEIGMRILVNRMEHWYR